MYQYRNTLRFYAFVIICLATSPALALNEGVFVTASFGQAILEVSERYSLRERREELETGKIGVSLGYRFVNGFELDLGANIYEELPIFEFFDAFDDYDVNEKTLALGYPIKLGAVFLRPKLGYAFWDFEAEEGRLGNPGPEARHADSGQDLFWSLGLEWPFRSGFGLSLSYVATDYDFGDVSTTEMGLRWRF